MKKHAFAQVEVFLLERRIGQAHKDAMWDKFDRIAKDLGFKIRVTGGNFLTHELVGGDKDDFNTIAELAAGI